MKRRMKLLTEHDSKLHKMFKKALDTPKSLC